MSCRIWQWGNCYQSSNLNIYSKIKTLTDRSIRNLYFRTKLSKSAVFPIPYAIQKAYLHIPVTLIVLIFHSMLSLSVPFPKLCIILKHSTYRELPIMQDLTTSLMKSLFWALLRLWTVSSRYHRSMKSACKGRTSNNTALVIRRGVPRFQNQEPLWVV